MYQCLQMLPNLLIQGKPFKTDSAHNYLMSPFLSSSIRFCEEKNKSETTSVPKEFLKTLSRFPKCKSKNRRLFSSEKKKNCLLTGLRRLNGNDFLGFEML